MRAPLLALAALLATTQHATAQQRVDERVPTGATGRVEVVNTAGSVTVIGWNRPEIHVTGTLGEGAERLAVSGDRERTEIRVVLPRGPRGRVDGSDIEVRLPEGKTLVVRTTSADIEVAGVNGALTLASTSGDVEVSGSPAEVTARSTSGDVTFTGGTAARVQVGSTSGDVRVTGTVREYVNAEAISGDVEIAASTPEVRATTVSGDLSLRGASGRVSASSVSGDSEIVDSRIQYGSFETVSGGFLFDGELLRGAAFNIQTHSGEIEMHLPGSVSSAFEIQTFSGEIENEFGPRAQRTGRRTPSQSLSFTAGGGDGLVTIRTFSGGVHLVRK